MLNTSVMQVSDGQDSYASLKVNNFVNNSNMTSVGVVDRNLGGKFQGCTCV